ncbi:MAG: hypothetical protein AAGF12_11180 [Myxococcota bacterium]
MNRVIKGLLGLLSVFPFVWIFVFTAFIFMSFGQDPSAMTTMFEFILPLHFLAVFGSLGLLVGYIVHLVRDETLETNAKVLWAVILVGVGLLALPVYWYLRIWKGTTS